MSRTRRNRRAIARLASVAGALWLASAISATPALAELGLGDASLSTSGLVDTVDQISTTVAETTAPLADAVEQSVPSQASGQTQPAPGTAPTTQAPLAQVEEAAAPVARTSGDVLQTTQQLVTPDVPTVATTVDQAGGSAGTVATPLVEKVAGTTAPVVAAVGQRAAPMVDTVEQTAAPAVADLQRVVVPVLAATRPVTELLTPVVATVEPMLELTAPVLAAAAQPTLALAAPALQAAEPVLRTTAGVLGVTEPALASSPGVLATPKRPPDTAQGEAVSTAAVEATAAPGLSPPLDTASEALIAPSAAGATPSPLSWHAADAATPAASGLQVVTPSWWPTESARASGSAASPSAARASADSPFPFAPGHVVGALGSAFASATGGGAFFLILLAALAAALHLAAPGLGRRLRSALAPRPLPNLELSLERPG